MISAALAGAAQNAASAKAAKLKRALYGMVAVLLMK
jgi:hypothetical protein